MNAVIAWSKRLLGFETHQEEEHIPPYRSRVKVSIGALLTLLFIGVALVIGISSCVPPAHQSETPNENSSISTPPTISSGTVLVHVGGDVKKPGLYELLSDSRVIDAVMAAGGAEGDIETCNTNLARVINDGEDITIHTSTTACSAANESTEETLSLNSATAQQLEELPGVGPALAEKIMSWRDAHGGFSDIAQLDEVPGIGPKLLEQLSPLISL